MKSSRRMKRMSRSRKRVGGINLTSLMDVFTILVFFLLVNSASSEILESPRDVMLPESIVESRPRETVVIFVSPEEVLVQGVPVARIEDILDSEEQDIEPIMERLAVLQQNVIGVSTGAVARSEEVTILADRSIPFRVIKKIMSTCAAQGYGRISLAVVQRGADMVEL
jgi:biopolymer transport protein ExbD